MSKIKIFAVEYVSFDCRDNYLYSDVNTFLKEDEARAFFEKECKSAYTDATNPNGSEDEDEWCDVSDERNGDNYFVNTIDGEFYVEVKLITKECEL